MFRNKMFFFIIQILHVSAHDDGERPPQPRAGEEAAQGRVDCAAGGEGGGKRKIRWVAE